MGVLVVVNAPPIFRALSKLVARFLHPDTRAKLRVFGPGPSSGGRAGSRVSPEAAACLAELCGAGALPAELGGDLPLGSPPYCY